MSGLGKIKGVLMLGDVHPITGAVFAQIDPRAVVVDSRYQRCLCERHVDFIEAGFWCKAVGTPDISVRNGNMFNMNGQHTIALAKRMGWKSIPVWLHNLCFKDEARFFAIKNSGKFNKRMAATQSYITAIMGEDEMSLDIQKICEEEGFTTPFNQEGKRGRADLTSISILEDVYKYKSGSPAALKKFLNVLKVFKINGTLDCTAKLNPFLRGLYDFMLSRPELSACKIRVMIKRQGKTAGAITSMAAEFACNGRVDRNHFRQVFEKLANL